MLMPRRVKHRKQQRGRMSGPAKGGTTIAFGDYALMTEEPGLHHEPPDRGRPARHDPLRPPRWQDLDPHLPRQAGDQEAGRGAHGLRQGRPRPLGRGRQARDASCSRWPASPRTEAAEAMRLASHKLPVDVKFLVREGAGDGHR